MGIIGMLIKVFKGKRAAGKEILLMDPFFSIFYIGIEF
jgi:hypothetical protein